MLRFKFPKGVIIAAIVLLSSQLHAQQEGNGGNGAVILDTSSFWRCHYTLKMPVVRKGKGIAPLHIAFREK